MSDSLQLILEDTDGTQLQTSCTRVAVLWQGKELWIQKTAYEIADSDWSSDVCSSDLNRAQFKDLRQFIQRRTAFDQQLRDRKSVV